MKTTAKITDWDGERWLGIECSDDIFDYLKRKNADEVVIEIPDGRKISPKQRRKIFALVADISEFCSGYGNNKDRMMKETLRQMKLLYVIDKSDTESIRRQLTLNYCNLSDIDMFSLSDIDMTTARDFIDWLIELCVKHDIPTNDTLLNLCEDVSRYMYSCVFHRRCCICGKKADIHEVEKVGLGRNRTKIHHLNQAVQPLCRSHHMEEENLGQKAFDEKYHLQFIRLDTNLCKKLKWRI